MRIDVICLTKTTNNSYFEMCVNTLKTMFLSEKHTIFDVIIVESEYNSTYDYYSVLNEYKNSFIKVIKPNEDFNYNRFINLGMKHINQNDWFVVINNDLIFEEGWFSKIMEVHSAKPDIIAFSPFEPDYHIKWFGDFDKLYQIGYTTGYHISGWCLVMNRSVLEAMGEWDENFIYWCQDDDYGEFLKRRGIKNALVRNSIVRHLHNKSNDIIDPNKIDSMTSGMMQVFNEKWSKLPDPLSQPKIKVVHLLLNPDYSGDLPNDIWLSRIEKQNESINCWRRISHNFTHYVESYSLLNRSELPYENCADPSIIDRSLGLLKNPPVLSYGHYGAYMSHKRAILEEFSDDIDALLIVEGDVQFSLDTDIMVSKIYDAFKFTKENDGAMTTFGDIKYGTSSDASIMNTEVIMGDWKKIDHFLCAHCYLIMKSEKNNIQEKLRSTGWHAWDIWLYWNYDKRVPIFAPLEPLVFEPFGISSIDYVDRHNIK